MYHVIHNLPLPYRNIAFYEFTRDSQELMSTILLMALAHKLIHGTYKLIITIGTIGTAISTSSTIGIWIKLTVSQKLTAEVG